MNDRYLYRAKRKNWRELPKEKWWVTGYLINKKCGKYNTVGFEEFEEMVIVTQFSDGGIDWCYIDKDTICQCTGLKDKNGKLIWENDIIKYHFGDVYAPIRYGEYQSCFDSTSTGHIGFYVDWTETKKENMRKDLGYWINMIGAEVVGNIFDNPELLEVGE